ncbi:MAG: recombinase family protein [Alphaproteobacteria bacterium]|nr:recombinase family protein [Alphaproteobacteria bacterium]
MSTANEESRRHRPAGTRPFSETEYEAAAVAAFIRARGVTRCPTACAVPTQATIAAADREALRKRWAEAEARRRVQHGRGPTADGATGMRPPAAPGSGDPGAKGRATLKAGADRFAASVRPIVERIQAAGTTGLTAIAEELNRRGIPAPRGGKWRGSAVRRLLARGAK